jgi:predicted dehydrogenase
MIRTDRLRVLVCGGGSIGRRHAANLNALGVEVRCWRARGPSAGPVLEGTPDVDVLDEGINWCQAMVVATATDQHMALASAAAAAGRHLFLEKPVAHSLSGVAELVSLVARRGLIVEVGCQLRMHPVLQAMREHVKSGIDGRPLAFHGCVGQRLDQWRPGTDYRNGYSADVSRGGGALFDLIHEIDLVLWQLGRPVGVAAHLSCVGGLGIQAEDLANLIIVLEDGCSGSLQLDMVSSVYRRRFEVVCEKASLRFDYGAGKLWRDAPGGTSELARVPDGFQRNDLFTAHMDRFLTRIRSGGAAACSLEEGVAALEVAVAAHAAARERRQVDLALKSGRTT